MPSETLRGIALGLWILTGLAFLIGALLPGSAGDRVLGPVLLALACLTTALTRTPSAIKTRIPARRRSLAGRITLAVIVTVLVLGIALTIIREGDQRSWIFVTFAAFAALVIGYYGEENRT